MNQAHATAHVPETKIGKWFLTTNVWTNRVLDIALQDLCRLMPASDRQYPVILDVACGYGESLNKLAKTFAPEKLIGMDILQEMLDASAQKAQRDGLENVEFIRCSNSMMELADNSVDMIFCHQTFHHLIYQEAAIAEYFRVLKPGGVLLFAESTKRYIHSWVIRLFFRHPMKVQKTADEYLQLIRGAGFAVAPEQVSYPYLWWSREDMGILENWFGVKPNAKREETLINLIAVKAD